MADRLELATFEPLVGEAFAVDAGGVTVELMLTEANRGPWQPDDGHIVAFELIFRGPTEPMLPQATYRMSHEALGPLDVFIVPLERGNEGTTYQAVFS